MLARVNKRKASATNRYGSGMKRGYKSDSTIGSAVLPCDPLDMGHPHPVFWSGNVGHRSGLIAKGIGAPKFRMNSAISAATAARAGKVAGARLKPPRVRSTRPPQRVPQGRQAWQGMTRAS
jgi:hypothetical protein